jgi:hypothetical protein
MLTNDFTGTYDYEKTEAELAANYLLDDLAFAYCNPEEFDFRITKEQIHWKKCLPDTFDDFNKHFLAAIQAGYANALEQFNLNA